MKRKNRTLVLALAIVGVAALCLGAAVYAKYIASVTKGAAIAKIAKWSFEQDNQTSTLTCDLAENYDTDTLVEGRIAPGTEGTCTLKVSNKNSEVGVNYEIVLGTLTGAPENLKFYKPADDGNRPDELTTESPITGTLAPGAEEEIAISWKWKYYTSDDGDTSDTAAGKIGNTMVAQFDITGTQVEPTY